MSINTKEWFVSYNPYTDVLQVYKKAVMTIDRSKLKKELFPSGLLLIDKDNKSPYLVELQDACMQLGDIDNMNKDDIIEKVKGRISHHGK